MKAEHCTIIENLVRKGGPEEEDDADFNRWVSRWHRLAGEGTISAEEISAIRSLFGASLSSSTMQGFALSKPHGYAGDYEIIDRIYQRYISLDPHLANWDRYYHRQLAPEAVRNRKAYFNTLLDRHYTKRRSLNVLKIAGGPGRCMFEWLSANPAADVAFRCVEIDPAAIQFAATLNRSFLDRVSFLQKNAPRYRPESQFGLVWAAGIFDYFTDAIFVRLLKRCCRRLRPAANWSSGIFPRPTQSPVYGTGRRSGCLSRAVPGVQRANRSESVSAYL